MKKAGGFKKYGITIFLLVLAISGWVLAINKNQDALYQILYNYKLVPIKEKFTELYFENHLNLPKEIVAGKQERFQFTIHNLEGAQTRYPYEVVFEGGGKRNIIAQSTAYVKDEEYKTIDVAMLFSKMVTGTVSVNLTDKNQSIHFLLKNEEEEAAKELAILNARYATSTLYFNNESALPTKIEKSKPENFSFAIRNFEGKEVNYPYVVDYVSGDNKIINIEKKTIPLKIDETKIVNVSMTFIRAVTGTINIYLPEKNYSIKFLLK